MKLISALVLSTSIFLVCLSSMGCEFKKTEKKNHDQVLEGIASRNSETVRAHGWKTVRSEKWNCVVGVMGNQEFAEEMLLGSPGDPQMTFTVEKFPTEVDAPALAQKTLDVLFEDGNLSNSGVRLEWHGSYCRWFVGNLGDESVIGRIYIREDTLWMICGFTKEGKAFDETGLRYFFDNFRVTL